MSLAIIGSSHVYKLKNQLYAGSIYPNGIDDRLPILEWFGKSGLRAFDLKNSGNSTRREITSRTNAQVACLIIGANDLDDIYTGCNIDEVLDSIRLTVRGILVDIPLVMVVPLFFRQYPRNNSCPYRHRYPGRYDYNTLLVELNKSLMTLKENRVKIVTRLNLNKYDLYDCVHLRPHANRKLLNTIMKCYKHMLNNQETQCCT